MYANCSTKVPTEQKTFSHVFLSIDFFLDVILISRLHLAFHNSNKSGTNFGFHESHLQSRSLQFVVTIAHIVAVANFHRTSQITKSLCTSTHPILESTSLQHRFKNFHEERKSKLTASTFAQAIGFWPNRRVQLWLEKIGHKPPFKGTLSTCWKNIKEEEALKSYITKTGNSIIFPDFHVHRNLNSGGDRDRNWNWLATSPDGIINNFPSRGVLEIKCPYYKGDMRKGYPWSQVPYNFIPQAQGVMEILDCDWMDFYVWTPKGSSLIRIDRDLEYWDLLKVALSDFWWDNVIPAREIYSKNPVKDPCVELGRFCPEGKHEFCRYIVEESKRLVGNSRLLMREFKRDRS